MSQNPLVSVIITFLNEERFLAEAIESALAQKYANCELILINDGSTDASGEIARNYIAKYPGKIIYAEHENHGNKGLSASRNLGIDLAVGELIAFLDADDIWTTDKLSRQVEIMLDNPQAAMLCEACEYWHDWADSQKPNVLIQIGSSIGSYPGNAPIQSRDKIFASPELAESLYPLGNGEAPSLSGILIRKSVLEKHSGFEEPFKGMYEDQAFLIKIYLNEFVYISSFCHHKYRQRQDSVSQAAISEGQYHVWRQYFLEWLERYLQQNDIRHERILRLTEKALEKYRKPQLNRFKGRLFSLYTNVKNLFRH